MTDAEIERFSDSLERCLAQDGFLRRFYDLFLNSSPEIRAKFEHTEFNRQRRLLQSSLEFMVMLAYKAPEAQAHFERLASLHDRSHRDIPPRLYALWLECLVAAVREYDTFWTAELEAIWRSAMQPGILRLTSRYEAVT